MIGIIFLHVLLAIILFFGMNLLGKYTPSNLGYFQLTTFLETDEAPAFNYVIRVLTPSVYLIIVSTILYALNLDRFTSNIYLIGVYYVAFRMVFNIATDRTKLINWPKTIFYSLSIIAFNFFVYTKFIVTKSNILPDFNNMTNELWLIIIIFLYNLINNIPTSYESSQKRKDDYVKYQFSRINRNYYSIISKETNVKRLKQIALAIIIYEDFNRPKLFRIIENISQLISKKPHTLGIMQVKVNKIISDKESVLIGMKKLINDYLELKNEFPIDTADYYGDQYKENTYQRRLIEKFNPDMVYTSEILDLADELNSKYYGNGSTDLFSKEHPDI